MTFTDPNDFTDCCNGLGGPGCGHEGLLRMPHLHADNCPIRLASETGSSSSGSPEILFREDPQERQQFDRSLDLFQNEPLYAISTSLDGWGRMHVRKDGLSGSYSQSCFIMANECIKAATKIKELQDRVDVLEREKAMRREGNE